MSALQPVSFAKGRQRLPRLSPPRVAGKHDRRYWTPEEDAIISRYYAEAGVAGCMAHLPARTTSSIYMRAKKLGLTAANSPIFLPADIDETLRRRWPELKGRGAVAALAHELGVMRWAMSNRARRLGLVMPHKKEPPWTAAEEALMRSVPLYNPDRCAEIFRERGFKRSPTAIMVKAKRLSISRRAARENFSAGGCAKLLGVDSKTFTSWIIAGDVKASRRGSKRLPQQGGDVWDVTPAELRRFIIERLERIDIRKVEKFAFVDLLTRSDAA